MLTVDVDKRITIDECLEHPWTTCQELTLDDSTEGLTGAMDQLDFAKRKVHRERTLLSSINDVKISRVINVDDGLTPVKVFEKNPQLLTKGKDGKGENGARPHEETPAANRDPGEFIQLGGKGDQPLFGHDGGSVYPEDVVDVKAVE